MQDIRAITFDLDDSLWAIEPVIRRAETRMHDHFREHFPEVARRHDPGSVHAMRARVIESHPHIAHDLSALRHVSFRIMLEDCGYDGVHADRLLEMFIAWRHEVEFFEDVVPALERLASRYRLFAVSNGNADVARLGLGDYFEGQVSAQSEGIGKPDPRIFHAACQRLDLDPGEVLHIGDHPVDDVEGALNAGLKAAWLNRVGADWPHAFAPHIACADLAEFAATLLD